MSAEYTLSTRITMKADMAATKAAFAYASALFCVIVAVASTAFADDEELKKQVDQIGNAYVESFKKQDAAGIAALFSTNAILVNPSGPQTDMTKVPEGTFKAGFNHMRVSIT